MHMHWHVGMQNYELHQLHDDIHTNPAQTTLLTQYVLNLAKYDMNYDIRDRAR